MAGREDIARTLHRAGAEREQIPELTNQIMQLHRSLGRGTAAQAAALAGGAGAELSTARTNTIRQLSGFQTELRSIQREARRAATAMSQMQAPTSASIMEGLEGDTGMSIPTAQDAYVNRGGLMGVSSGDIVVSRRHLANAVLARQGAMAGPAVSMAGEGMMAGPTPTVPGGGGGTMNISIPVMLDGREIARAVGRANVTQLERGGGRLPPGQRRSLRETGFSRSV